jgi:carbon monoxide dehydrogenase subunit G
VRFRGTRTLRATPEAIWAYLMTPDRLRRCLPGCERFEATDPTTFAATLRLGVAFLKGTYHGTVRVTEQDYPSRLGLAIEGTGLLGSLRAGGVLTFSSPR